MKPTHLLVPATVVALVAALTSTATATTTTSSVAASDPAGPPLRVVATGLDNPRQLSFSGADLYVAEAGTGGPGPCFEGPEGETCYGLSGAVTRIRHGRATRVAQHLPSLAAPDGSSAIGAGDVQAGHRGRLTVVLGLGNDPAVRATLPRSARLLGTVVTSRGGTRSWHRSWRARPRWRVVADLAAREAAVDPDGAGPDSNPVSLAAGRAGWVVSDAGANAVLTVSHWGRTRELAVLDSPGEAPLPFPPFDPVPTQSVPTSAVQGPDGAWYVSELTGFPFPAGMARIHRVDRQGRRTVWATGLTNVTDLAWHRGQLYAVQLTDEGLLAGEGATGSLVRVARGATPVTVVDGLAMPYGVAFRHHTAYLTTCAVCPEGGQVVAADLS